MFSQATSDGALTLTITFALGTDLDTAQVQVQNRVAQALPRLPQDVQRIGVTTEKASPDFLLVAHLVSPDERYDMLYLSNYALLQVKDELARLPGVGSVQVFGAGEYSMRVWLDPNRLASRQLTRATSCGRSASRTSRWRPGCSARRRRLPAPPSSSPINAQGRLTTEEEFGHIVVRATRRGADHPPRGRRPPRARIEPLLPAQPARQQARGGDRRLPAARHQRAPGLDRRARDDGAAEAELPARRRLPDRLRPDGLRAGIDQRRGPYAARGDPARRPRRGRLPADVAGLDHPARRRAGVARSAPSRSCSASASRSTRSRSSASCSPSASSSTTRSWWSRTSNGTSSWGSSRWRRRGGRWRRSRGRSSRSRSSSARCSCRPRSSAG